MEWHDFPIEITREAAQPRVRVLGPQPGGEMAAADAEPFVAPDIAVLVGKLERRKASQDQMFELGRLLGAALMPGRVREIFAATRRAIGDDSGVRIRLIVEAGELAALPWEYAHVARTGGDPQAADFLALASGVSLVRHQVTGSPLAAVPDKAAFRVVLAIAEPEDLAALALDRDRAAVEAALDLVGGDTGVVELDPVRPATRTALRQALRAADVFHFAGHGGFGAAGFADDGTPRTAGFLVLENDAGNSDHLLSGDLALMLEGAGARLVVLGACESATRDEHGPWSGVASALTRNDVPAVVAMQFKVLDDNASRFMAPFYAAVFAGRSVDEAVSEGRRAIFHEGSGVTERDWGVPALYLRTTDGVLFRVPKEGADRSAGVLVEQRIKTVRGLVSAGEVESIEPGAPSATFRQVVDKVEEPGEVHGPRIRRLGGGSQ